MQKIHKKIIAYCSCALIIFGSYSCSLKKDNPSPQKSLSQLLTNAKSWKLSTLEFFDAPTNAWVSEPIDGDFYYASFLTFTTITFTADGKLNLQGQDGGANNSYTDTGTWGISSSTITITPVDESPQISAINTLTETTWMTSWSMNKISFGSDGGHGTAVSATKIRETFTAVN